MLPLQNGSLSRLIYRTPIHHYLHENSMSDTVIGALIIALTNNSRLKELKLGWNLHATAAGWVAFLTILQTPNSALEVLHLQQNSINEQQHWC